MKDRVPLCSSIMTHSRTEGCRGRDLNPRTTKDKALNLAPLAKLDYPCVVVCDEDRVNKLYRIVPGVF